MIPTRKSNPKHVRIEGTSRAQKTDKNSSKRHEHPTSYKPGIDETKKASKIELYLYNVFVFAIRAMMKF
jgi:hypothetical protein